MFKSHLKKTKGMQSRWNTLALSSAGMSKNTPWTDSSRFASSINFSETPWLITCQYPKSNIWLILVKLRVRDSNLCFVTYPTNSRLASKNLFSYNMLWSWFMNLFCHGKIKHWDCVAGRNNDLPWWQYIIFRQSLDSNPAQPKQASP